MDYRKMDLKTGLAVTILIAVVAIVVFQVVALEVAKIDVATVNPVFQDVIVFLQKFFASGPIAFLVTWFANISGYAINLAGKKAQEQNLSYNLYKFWQTTALYLGAGAILFGTLPEPYNKIGLAFVFVIKLVGNVIEKIVAEAQTKPLAPT
jgi:hypothetical protein